MSDKINAYAVTNIAREIYYSMVSSGQHNIHITSCEFSECLKQAEIIIKMQTEYVESKE